MKTNVEIEKQESKLAKIATLRETFANADIYDYLCMFIGCVGSLLSGASLPAFSVLLGRVIDNLNKGQSITEAVNSTVIIFVVVAAINIVSGMMQVVGWSIAGERQSERFKAQYVQAILSQEVGWFDTCGAGELSTRVADLGGKLQVGLTRRVSEMIQNGCEFILCFVVSFYMCWQLAVVLLAAFPLIGFCAYFMIQAVAAAHSGSSTQYAKAGGLATEMLGAIRTVTALNDQPSAIDKYRSFVLEAMEVGLLKSFKVGLGNGTTYFVTFGVFALGFWYGGELLTHQMRHGCTGDNCYTGGHFVSVFIALMVGANALGQIIPPMNAFVAARVAVKSMLEVIHRTPLIDGLSEAGYSPSSRPQGKISIKEVEFAYPSRPNLTICKGYNLEIEPGQTVALCGPSGAGKSTVINLLLRFYDPSSGLITLDDTDIRTLNIRWLRSCIGYVGQEPVLFAGTIAENIAYGVDRLVEQVDEATLRERVYAAAKMANAHDFIMSFPKGYDTDVSGSGSSLSGGQKQRIAIARALIKKPAVLLLDEATSALDATSERLVQASIDELQKGHAQTTIVIAHRLSTIRNADKIAVVNNGVIAELGTHNELFALGGLYTDLVNLQMSGHEDIIAEDIAEHSELITEERAVEPVAEKTTSGFESGAELTSGSSRKNGPKNVSDGGAAVTIIISRPADVRDPDLKKKMWAVVWPHAHWLALGVLGAALTGSAFPIYGLLLSEAQSMYYLSDPDEVMRRSIQVATYFVLLGIDCLVGCLLQFYCIGRVGEAVSAQLRSSMFESLMRREISYFDDERNGVGALTTRLANDARLVHEGSGEAMVIQFQAVFTLLTGLIVAFTASWKIALVVLATFPLLIVAASIKVKAKSGHFGDTDEADGGSQGAIISSAFTHMRTVSAFSMQHAVSAQYDRQTVASSEQRQGRSVYFGAGVGFSNSARFLTYALLFWYGAQLMVHDGLSFVHLMSSINSLMIGALGLGMALNEIGDQKEGLQAAHRIFTMIAEAAASPIDGLSTSEINPDKPSKGRIVLEGVNFAYPTRPGVQVCKDYDLVIEPGEVVALVGPSGSGKSTIINLLLRFYDPLAGRVLLDGQDITTLNVRWLRSQIGYVGQEPVLFTGSVADNIAKGRSSAQKASDALLGETLSREQKVTPSTGEGSGKYHPVNSTTTDVESGSVLQPEKVVDEDIVSACIASNAHDFIKTFPQGYETDVGEGSVMVSGGQKQRIAIARALIKKPTILLLDEATSALDAASERLVQASIDELQKGHAQTTIVIAHRLSTIRNADKIAVIDGGRVVEIGSHDQLLAHHGLYEELWNKQMGLTSR